MDTFKVQLSVLTIILAALLSFVNNYGQIDKKLIERLTKESEVIVIGKVSGKESFWNEGKTRIYSRVKINPYEYLKSDNQSTDITLTLPGGEVGEVGELYTHIPTFENEEEVLIFAKKDKGNNYKITGGESGKIKLIRDRTTGELLSSSLSNLGKIKTEIKNHLAK